MQLYNTLKCQRKSRSFRTSWRCPLNSFLLQYAHIGNPELFRNHLFLAWDSLGVLGRIYVAKEGINAQLSVPGEKF